MTGDKVELKKCGEKGFTLVELLIIVAILAVLAAVVIPNVTGMFDRSSEVALNTDATIIQTSVTLFRWDVHRGVSDGSWGKGPDGHYYPTDDGYQGTLTSASFPLTVGETNPGSTLDGIIWMGLLANSPGDAGGDDSATARPQIGEEGSYLYEIPKSASIYNGREIKSGPYTWIILNNGAVAAVEITGNNWMVAAGPYVPIPTTTISTVTTLTVGSTTSGWVIVPGEGTFTYDEGTQVNLFAVPDTDKWFVNWTGDVDTIADVSVADTTITMHGDYSIAANFNDTKMYTLAVDSTAGGSVTVPGEGTFTYAEGAQVNLLAVPDAGEEFLNWTGDVDTVADVNAADTTITMEGDYSITANFKDTLTYTLTVGSTAGGSVIIPGEGTYIYAEGTEVNLLAGTDACNGFANWTGDVDTVADVNAADTTITMEGDYSITANFTEGEFAKISIQIDPEIEAWISIQDKSTGEWAIDTNGVPVDGSNHRTPASIWIPFGYYTVSLQKEGWTHEVDLPPTNPSICKITVKIKL